VAFPASIDLNPLRIKTFETDLPLFKHHLSSLHDSVEFEEMFLSTSNADIHADSVTVERGSFRTTNSRITGSFISNRSLSLSSKNGPVQVSVQLKNGPSTTKYETGVDIRTTNAPVEAQISLVSPGRLSGGKFAVHARTQIDQINIPFLSSPYSASLTMVAETTNGKNEVSLHPAYEGKFEACTSLTSGRPELHYGDQYDPSGEQRKRLVDIEKWSDGVMRGIVRWGEGDGNFGRGSALLKTSNAPISLTV